MISITLVLADSDLCATTTTFKELRIQLDSSLIRQTLCQQMFCLVNPKWHWLWGLSFMVYMHLNTERTGMGKNNLNHRTFYIFFWLSLIFLITLIKTCLKKSFIPHWNNIGELRATQAYWALKLGRGKPVTDISFKSTKVLNLEILNICQSVECFLFVCLFF